MIKTKKSSKKTTLVKKKKVVKSKNIGFIYKVIALSFVGITLTLSLMILFVSSAKTTITITTKDADVNIEENIEILLGEASPNESQISGQLLETDITLTESFTVEQGDTKDAQAVGQIVIVNNYSKDQPLVASTRFLSEDGVLFRLKDTVNAPSGGEVAAEIYADEPGISGEVGPGKFTIPGLWAGLQDQIYATSTDPTSGGTQVVGELKETDVVIAVETIKAKAMEEGLAKLNLELAESNNGYKINSQLILQEVIEQKSSATIGEEVNEFEITLKSKLITIAIDENEIFELIKTKLANSAPDGFKLIEINQESFAYLLENYNSENDKIIAKASLSGKISADNKESFIDKTELIGLTQVELDNYFAEKSDSISSVNYHFSPFWLKHVATNERRIKIIID